MNSRLPKSYLKKLAKSSSVYCWYHSIFSASLACPWGDLYVNLRKIILGVNSTEIAIVKDLMIPNGKATIMG